MEFVLAGTVSLSSPSFTVKFTNWVIGGHIEPLIVYILYSISNTVYAISRISIYSQQLPTSSLS